jgi:hypothetical protein
VIDASCDEDPEAFATLYVWFVALMSDFADKFRLTDGDAPYLVHGSPIHKPQIGIQVHHLTLLGPDVVGALQRVLESYPRWEIAYTVEMPGEDLPEMGLLIRKDIIIDGLKRQYLPIEHRSITYEGSRDGDISDLIARPLAHPEFEPLFREVECTLSRRADLESPGQSAFMMFNEYAGGENLVLMAKAALMQPEMIAELQGILQGFPAWTIMVMPDHVPLLENIAMVVEVRRDEIVDRLDRSRLPPEYANLHYPGARRERPLGEAGGD